MVSTLVILMDMIDRTFDRLGAEKGFQQNAIDVCALRDRGEISDRDYYRAREYNRKVYAEMPFDWEVVQ